MDQITVVLYQGTVRVQRGHTSVDGQLAYLDGLDAPVGSQVEFVHVDLYSDVGDGGLVHYWTLTERGDSRRWTR
jgi:hypothetical protein